MKLYRTMLATLLCLASGIGRAYADFMPLGDLPGGMFLSRAAGVSADGSTVVGESVSASGFEAFRWTQPGGMLSLGVPSTSATATSATGSVVVGTIINGDEAFRWTQAGGIVGLGFLPGDAVSRAFGVSADGSVVVGNSSGIFFQAFRWTTTGGMVGLGFLPGGDLSSALAVSANGAVVVGASDSTGVSLDIDGWNDWSGRLTGRQFLQLRSWCLGQRVRRRGGE